MKTVPRDELRRASANPKLVGLTPEDIVDSLDEIYYFVSLSGMFIQWNKTLPDVIGCSDDEIKKKKVTSLFIKEDKDRVKSEIGKTITTRSPRTFEAHIENADGEEVPYEFSAKPVTDDQGSCHGVIGIGRDISERKKREMRLDKILSHSPVYLFVVDSDGVVRLSRGNILQELGLTEGAGVGRHITELYDDTELINVVERACEGETIQETVNIRDIHLDIICEPIMSGDVVERVVGVGYDVSSLKKYENQIETQRDQLHLLNSVVRRDIRNNLQVIQAYTDLLASEVPDDKADHVEIIKENIESALGLTVTAKELSEVMLGTGSDACKEVHLTNTLLDVVDNIESRFSHAEVTTPDDIPIHHVEAHELLDAVFRNILMNAVLHNDKDTPKVTVEIEDDGDMIEVQVADNGPGIDDDRKEKIFGKKETGMDSAGSGIGLYLVKLITERSRGDVWVTDNEPCGSVFHVKLPKINKYN